jgi:hypothetical protein
MVRPRIQLKVQFFVPVPNLHLSILTRRINGDGTDLVRLARTTILEVYWERGVRAFTMEGGAD